MSLRNFRLLFTGAAFTAVAAFAQTTTVTRTSDFSFPLVGLATTETMAVNLINLASNPTIVNATSCAGSVSFINQAGATIGSATNFTLGAGAGSIVSLPFSSSGITGTRGLVRAVVATTLTSNVPCSLSYSLNTYDTVGGVTHVFIQGTGSNIATPVFTVAH